MKEMVEILTNLYQMEGVEKVDRKIYLLCNYSKKDLAVKRAEVIFAGLDRNHDSKLFY